MREGIFLMLSFFGTNHINGWVWAYQPSARRHTHKQRFGLSNQCSEFAGASPWLQAYYTGAFRDHRHKLLIVKTYIVGAIPGVKEAGIYVQIGQPAPQHADRPAGRS